MVQNEYYAIKIGGPWFLGPAGLGMGPNGPTIAIGPTKQAPILIPIDADEEEMDSFKELAKSNGGKLVLMKYYNDVSEYNEDGFKFLTENTKSSN